VSSTFFRRLVFAAAVVVAAAAPARATMMIERMSLDRITREAGRIVHGTVTDVRSGRDESGLPATWVTLDVARTLKGHATTQLTFKQAGVTEPLPDGTLARIPGLPRYTVGEEVVLFLRGESAHGFTSPVGMGQGTFRVSRRAAVAEVRTELGSEHDRGGKLSLDDFLSAVSTLAASPE
jgi:hypothetical protein